MKIHPFVFIAALLLSMACGRRYEVSYPEGIENSPLNRARKLCNAGAPASEYMPLQEEALRELREGRSPHDPVAVLAQSGDFYSRMSDYPKAIGFFQEAADWRRVHREGETREDVMLLGNLGTLYGRLEMWDESIAAFRQASEISQRYDNYALDDISRFMARGYIGKERFDSALMCLDRALEVLDATPSIADREMLRAGILSDKAVMWVENHELFADSISKSLEYLEAAIRMGGRRLDTERFLLGQAYVLSGNQSDGLPMMEDMAKIMAESGRNEDAEYACRKLMETYAALGLNEKSGSLYPGYVALRDSVNSGRRITATIAADVRYKSDQNRLEAKRLEQKLERTRIRIVILSFVGLLMAVLAVRLIFRYRKAWKQSRKKRENQAHKITALLESQRELNTHIKNLTLQMELAANKEALASEQARVSTEMLLQDEEPQFRKAFSSVYPSFLPDIRRMCPAVTKKDELLLMLIFLRQSTDEIAHALNISYASVNSARFRLRKKFGLSKEDDLDDFIFKIIAVR